MFPDLLRLSRFLTILYINITEFQYITPDPYLPLDHSPSQWFSHLLTFIEYLQWQGVLCDDTQDEALLYTYITILLIHFNIHY